jgi:hypothetical protein
MTSVVRTKPKLIMFINQEILVRSSRLRSLWTAEKTRPPTVLLFLFEIFAQEHVYQAVSSYDRRNTHTDTHTHVRDVSSTPLKSAEMT